MKLAVILVNYNGEKYNTACIDSILASVGMEELKIIVADNASQDNSVRLLEERYAKMSGWSCFDWMTITGFPAQTMRGLTGRGNGARSTCCF